MIQFFLLFVEPGFLLGAAGMFAGSRRCAPEVKAARWLKFATYFVIVHLMLALLMLHGNWSAGAVSLILAVCLGEIIRLSVRERKKATWQALKAIGLFITLAALFEYFILNAGWQLAVYVYMLVYTLDAGSQISGQLLGRHQLAPRISPAKTAEGTAGGILSATVIGLLLADWAGLNLGQAVITIILCATAGVMGDLAGSWYKRVCGVKDYSRLLPGQGGFTDRFNSFIAAGAACGLLMTVKISFLN